MRLWNLFLLLSLVLVLGCDKFSEETPHGYAFRIHRQLGTEQAQIDDVLYVQFQIRTSERILFTSPNGEAGMRIVLQDPSLNPIKDPDPIADVLPLMGEGDSVTVRMEVTDEMRDAFGLATASEIFYDVVIRHIGERETDLDQANNPAAKKQNLEKLAEHSRELYSQLQQDLEAQKALRLLLDHISDQRTGETFLTKDVLSKVLVKGTGPRLGAGDVARVKHIAALSNGSLISESITGKPFTFTVDAGQVIKAWERAVTEINIQGKSLLIVPPEMGYGATGREPFIGPQDTVYYYFELVE